MLDWLKNMGKDYPDYWKNYLSKFEKKPSRFVALSLETTGLNPKKDIILSVGAIGIEHNKIVVKDVLEIEFPKPIKEEVSENVIDQMFKDVRVPKVTESVALEKLIDYIGNSIIVGHRTLFDIEIINETLEKYNCGRLKNESLDIEVMYKKLLDINDKNFSLDDLKKTYKIDTSDRTSTVEDAYSIGLLFLKLKSKLDIHIQA